MNKQELIANAEFYYEKATENLKTARENVSLAQKTLESAGQMFRNAAKNIPFEKRSQWIHQNLLPYQEAVKRNENKVTEIRDMVDNYRNLLEAAEISIDAYEKLNRQLKKEGKIK